MHLCSHVSVHPRIHVPCIHVSGWGLMAAILQMGLLYKAVPGYQGLRLLELR